MIFNINMAMTPNQCFWHQKIFDKEKKENFKTSGWRNMVRIAEARRLREKPILIYIYGRMGCWGGGGPF